MWGRIGRRLGVLLVGVAIFFPAELEGADAASGGTEAFCRPSTVVRNFLAPLDRLPAINGFSDSGRLTSDGPEVLRVNPPRESLVMSDRGGFEAVGHLDGGRHSDAALNWRVDSELSVVWGHGYRQRVIK